jgi:hypothetical protein
VLVLNANFDNVPREVMRLIDARVYRTVSSEVYDNIPDGLPDAGRPMKMFRRVAFPGGEIPQNFRGGVVFATEVGIQVIARGEP